MTVIELLKVDDGARVTWEDNWMFWRDGEWVVYSSSPYDRRIVEEYRGTDEEAAVDALSTNGE